MYVAKDQSCAKTVSLDAATKDSVLREKGNFRRETGKLRGEWDQKERKARILLFILFISVTTRSCARIRRRCLASATYITPLAGCRMTHAIFIKKYPGDLPQGNFFIWLVLQDRR